MLRKFLLGMLFCGLSLSAQGMHQEEDSAASGKKVSRTALATQEQAHVEDFTSAISCLNGREYAAAAEKFADLAERGSFEALTYFHGLSISNGSKKVVCFNGHGKVPTIDIDQKMAALGKLVYGENLPYTKGAGRRGKRKKKQVDQGIFYRHTLEEALAEYCDNEKHAQFLQKTEGAVFARMIITKAAKKPLAKQLQALRILTNYKAVSLEQGVHEFTEGLLRNRSLETKRRIYYRAQRALCFQDLAFEYDPYLPEHIKRKIRPEMIRQASVSDKIRIYDRVKDTLSMDIRFFYAKAIAESQDSVPEIQYDYAQHFLTGERFSSKARTYYKLAADSGYVHAQQFYARMLCLGEGGDEDLAGARTYCKMAADQGDVRAQNNYASMLVDGDGGSVDLEQARYYYKLAADQGLREAQNNYALMLKEGKGGGIDLEKALYYYKLAANQGLKEAQHSYAMMLSKVTERKAGNVALKSEIQEIREKDVVKYLKLSADQGNPAAQNDYARKLEKGEGVAIDLEEARKYYKLAADQGLREAQVNYATMIEQGVGGDQDLEQARCYYKLAADNGLQQAQYAYAQMLYFGVGGDIDLLTALIYCKMAADQGLREAQNNYASMLKEGKGGDIDLEKALYYYKLAADQKMKEAQYNYAVMNYFGQGGDRDLVEALRYYELAADQGYAPAQYNYGDMLYFGKGVLVDQAKARYYYQLSADQGYALAQYNYGCMLQFAMGGGANLAKARHYYQLAAEQGNLSAQTNYAYMLYLGKGGDKDLAKARHYCQLAANQGGVLAQYAYAVMLGNGEGGDADLEGARIYFKKAAAQGSLYAIRALAIGADYKGEESLLKDSVDTPSQVDAVTNLAIKKKKTDVVLEDDINASRQVDVVANLAEKQQKPKTEEAPSSSSKSKGSRKKERSQPRLVLRFSGKRKATIGFPEDKVEKIKDRKARNFVRCFFNPQEAKSLKDSQLRPTLEALGAEVTKTKSGWIAKIENDGTKAIFSCHLEHGRKRAFHKGGFRKDLKIFLEAMGYFDVGISM